jgi:hypothetical protein
MQTTIESFSDYKKTDRGPSAKIKTTNGDLIYINEEPAPLVGKTVDIDVNEKTSQKGNRYKVGKILKVYETTASNANSNGKITWDAYRAMAEAAHELAEKLEPDQLSTTDGTEMSEPPGGAPSLPLVVVDRSTARAAILNTVMIAYSNGKIFVPADEDDIPPF